MPLPSFRSLSVLFPCPGIPSLSSPSLRITLLWHCCKLCPSGTRWSWAEKCTLVHSEIQITHPARTVLTNFCYSANSRLKSWVSYIYWMLLLLRQFSTTLSHKQILPENYRSSVHQRNLDSLQSHHNDTEHQYNCCLDTGTRKANILQHSLK